MPGRALVTGAAGFLGSAIVAALAAEGHDVLGVDRIAALQGIRSRILALPGADLEAVLAEERPSLIVHAAGPASVGASIEDPAADFAGSVVVTASLLDAVRRTVPEARVVLLSSAAVYGNPASLPVGEDARLAPLSPYGFHKTVVESLGREYAVVYGLKTASLRIFSAYGAGLARQLLWDVCEKASVGGAVRLFGTGEETRDFIHVDDVASAVLAVAARAPMTGEAYNVASGTETSVREIASQLVAAVALGTPVEFTGEARAGDPLRWRADISRLRALGFVPARTLEDGLAEYAAWYLARTPEGYRAR